VQGMDDAPHFALKQSDGTPHQISDGWRVPALLIGAMVGLVIATAAGVALLIMYKLDAALVPTQLQILALHADARARALETYTQSARASVLTLSKGNSLLGMTRATLAGGVDPVDHLPLSEWRRRLAKRLLDEISLTHDYYQFRLITADGREIVRVEQTAKAPRIAPDAGLQQKGQSDYFRETMKLAAGQVYVSPIDLNKEFGRIETPLVPVVRVAAPIFLPDGNRFGILIINLDMRPIFAQMRAQAPLLGDIRIINVSGDYVLHPDAAREYRFEYGETARLADDFPDLARRALDVPSQILTRDKDGRLFGLAIAPGRAAEDRAFSVVDVLPYSALAVAPKPVREATLIAGAIAALCAAFLSIIIANVLSHRVSKVMASVDRLSQEELAELAAAAEQPHTGTKKTGLWRLLHLTPPERELRRDLLRRRRNELLLRSYLERDQLYAAVVRSATDAIITKTLDGKITGWNAAAEKLFGYTAREAIGQPIDIIVPRERLGEIDRILHAVGRGELIDHFETVRRTKTGRLIDLSLSISPIKASSGEIVGSAKIVRDISEQKFNERKFQLAVEASPGGVLMINQSGEIVLANAELERQFGYSRSELVGASVDLLLPKQLRQAHAAQRAEFYAEPAVRRMGAGRDLHARRKDGSEFPVEIGLNPIQSGDGLMVLATIIDITERKEAERAIEEQNIRLRRSNAELEQFAYVASHDLQEPLRMVASYTQLLEDRYKDQLDDKAHKYIGYAVEGAKRMQALVRDLLSFSRVSSKEATNKPVDSAVVVAAAIERLTAAIQEAAADVRVGPLPVVMSEELELGQVFQNLISNAVKFRSAQSARIEISAERKGAVWEFAVKDNGIGVEEKYGSRIFQMFQRLHERGKYDGSGIGLAIVKKIVERHGGAIWFSSVLGEGTTFYFTALAEPETTTTATTTMTMSEIPV
jgi:PAS domain S-box-containing protein